MARKKQPKRRWLPTVALLLAIPLIVWAVSFVLRLYRDDLGPWWGGTPQPAKSIRSIQKEVPPQRSVREAPREKLTDEDRQKLDDILKQRN